MHANFTFLSLKKKKDATNEKKICPKEHTFLSNRLNILFLMTFCALVLRPCSHSGSLLTAFSFLNTKQHFFSEVSFGSLKSQDFFRRQHIQIPSRVICFELLHFIFGLEAFVNFLPGLLFR